MPSGRSHIRNFGCVMTLVSWSIGSSVVARTVRSQYVGHPSVYIGDGPPRLGNKHGRANRDAGRSSSQASSSADELLEPGDRGRLVVVQPYREWRFGDPEE